MMEKAFATGCFKFIADRDSRLVSVVLCFGRRKLCPFNGTFSNHPDSLVESHPDSRTEVVAAFHLAIYSSVLGVTMLT
jgi:hypothetical protein